MEVGDHAGSQGEIIGREDKLVRPSLKLLQAGIRTDSCFNSTHDGSTDHTHLMPLILGLVHCLHGIRIDKHLLGVHLMLGQILHINLPVVTQTGMQRQVGELTVLDLQTFHQLTAEMQAGSRCDNSPLFRCEDVLVTVRIFRFNRTVDVFRQGCFAQCIQGLFEVIVIAVIEESQRTTT